MASTSREGSLDQLNEYRALCGWALALAHAKSGDPAMIAGYCGTSDVFPDAVARFSVASLEQTLRDYEVLAAAVRKGRIAKARRGGARLNARQRNGFTVSGIVAGDGQPPVKTCSSSP